MFYFSHIILLPERVAFAKHAVAWRAEPDDGDCPQTWFPSPFLALSTPSTRPSWTLNPLPGTLVSG